MRIIRYMNVVSVKFISDNKILDFDDTKDQYNVSDFVIVNTSQVAEIVKIVDKYKLGRSKNYKNPKDKGKILRKVSKRDREKINKNKSKALKFISKCKEKIKRHNLSMEVVDADLSFDEKKLTVYFSSEKRVDFRTLVADFVRSFKKLVRLQQIDSREQVRRMGGIGKCGEEICCARFLGCSELVTLDYVRRQNLGEVKGSKISGACGKLMCCLRYEDELYTEAKKDMPKIGDKLKTEQGIGKVIKQNVLSKTVTVELDNDNKLEVRV